MKKWFLVQPGLLLALVAYTASSSAAAEKASVEEIGKETSGGLEITLVSAPPRSQEEMKKMMQQMGQTEMQKMMQEKGMGGMMGMGSMMEMPSQPATHYLGVIIRDQKTQKVIPNLKVTLTAKGPVARKAELMAMPGSYAQNISLPTGQYEVFVIHSVINSCACSVGVCPVFQGWPTDRTWHLTQKVWASCIESIFRKAKEHL